MRRFTPEEEAILKGQLQVAPNYRALWQPQAGRTLPDDSTGWVWLGKTPNDFTPTAEAIAERIDTTDPAEPLPLTARPFVCHRCSELKYMKTLHMMTHPELKGGIVLVGGDCRDRLLGDAAPRQHQCGGDGTYIEKWNDWIDGTGRNIGISCNREGFRVAILRDKWIATVEYRRNREIRYISGRHPNERCARLDAMQQIRDLKPRAVAWEAEETAHLAAEAERKRIEGARIKGAKEYDRLCAIEWDHLNNGDTKSREFEAIVQAHKSKWRYVGRLHQGTPWLKSGTAWLAWNDGRIAFQFGGTGRAYQLSTRRLGKRWAWSCCLYEGEECGSGDAPNEDDAKLSAFHSAAIDAGIEERWEATEAVRSWARKWTTRLEDCLDDVALTPELTWNDMAIGGGQLWKSTSTGGCVLEWADCKVLVFRQGEGWSAWVLHLLSDFKDYIMSRRSTVAPARSDACRLAGRLETLWERDQGFLLRQAARQAPLRAMAEERRKEELQARRLERLGS